MPSAFAHALVPAALALGVGRSQVSGRLLLLALVCAVMPDLDVIAFKFGIAYASPWGHRGFTHSIVFSVLVALLASACSRALHSRASTVFVLILVAVLSHALLDMLTDGGLGVALYWPLSEARVFFPYRPIAVSPIGVASFFSARGWAVLQSELVWVGLPVLALGVALRVWRRR